MALVIQFETTINTHPHVHSVLIKTTKSIEIRNEDGIATSQQCQIIRFHAVDS